ncbi:hypothetical protein ABPG74_007276 [Tetrahymena malaccensis]
MLRVVHNLGKSVKINLASKNILRVSFSSDQKVSTEAESGLTFEQKAQIFERFSNSFAGIDRFQEIQSTFKKISEANYSQSAIQEELVQGLKEVYGKNYEKILNLRFTVEYDGHKDGVAVGEFELFPKNLQDTNKFENYSKNGDLIKQLQQTTYISVDPKETHKYVVPKDSHFSLLLDEYIADEYVSELSDNQVCLFGFPLTCDESDITNLLNNEFKGNFTSSVIGEDVLSLPAYVVLTFSSPKEAAEYKQKVNALQYTFEKRPIYATTFEDSRREHSTNRTLLVTGFKNKEYFNDMLNLFSTFGSVMHFEIVEDPVHSKLPTTEQVIDYLKKNVKEGDDSVVYEITDISDGAPSITEYPPYNPSTELMRDAKKVHEVQDEIELEKERQQQLAKRQLIPRIVLYSWDSDSRVPEEYKLKNASEEQQKIIQSIENNLRTQYKNKQYLFVTYACTQQAQIAHHALNNLKTYEATLKKSIEHYHCDTTHQTSVFKEIKQVKGDFKIKFNEQSLVKAEEEKLLAQSHQEMREKLLEQANSQQFTQELSKQIESEIIGKTKYGIEHQLHLKSDKLGRDFNSKVTRDDLNQLAAQFQENQKKNLQTLEEIRKDEEELLNLYKAKVMYSDINKITHPYIQADKETIEKVEENYYQQQLKEYKLKQKEYMKEQQIREKWLEESKEMLEKKFVFGRNYKKKALTEKTGADEVPDIKEPKEEEADQYYAPYSDYIQQKRYNKYLRYVDEMQRLYDGEYSEAMKNKIFVEGGKQTTDSDGKLFVTKQEGEVFDKILLSDEQFEMLKYYTSIADVLPNKRVKELQTMLEETPEETIYMMKQLQYPTKVFDRSKIPELDENSIPISNEDFVNDLNKYVAGLGERYAVQKDARGDEKIVMYENTPHPVPLHALNIDEIQLLRDCLTTYGFDAEATEREIQYFLKHGDYSEEVLKIVGNEQTIDEENELEALINATGLSKAELDSILKLDLEKDGSKVLLSLQEQREELSFEIARATPQPKDLIKTNNTKLRNKDKQGRYKTSNFKLF